MALRRRHFILFDGAFLILMRSFVKPLSLLKPRACWPLLLSALVLPTALPGGAQQQEAAQTAQQRQQFGDTIVTADSIDFDLGKKQVIAAGNVDLVSRNSHLTADTMTVQMAANKGLEWANAEGKVVLERKNPDDNTSVVGRGQKMEFSEAEQKANLQGNVVVHLSSPRLAKPAVLTGARVDLDLKSQKNTIVRGADAQAKVHVEPKGEEGKPNPEPVDLVADRIEMNTPSQEYVATGKPVLVRPTSRLQATRIRFQVEDGSNDVKVAYADENVVFDGQGENGSTIHTTADNGVFNREINELVLKGMVTATIKDPDQEQPTLYQGARFIYNTKTRKANLQGDPSRRATIVVPPGGALDKKPDAAPGGDSKDKK